MEKYEDRDSIVLNKNGQKLFAVVHRPISQNKTPAVLICHGLAGHKIGHQRIYVMISEALSKAGIASIRVDFRGSGDSEGEFADMTIDSEVEDAMLGMEWLSKQPFIDPNRIGVYGRSFGGAVALLTAAQFGSVKSIALWSPIFNASQWEAQWEKSESGMMDEAKRHELMRINGQMPSMAFYQQLFQLNLNESLNQLQNVPLLHIHGEKDPIVSIEHADFYAKTRRQAKGESKFVRLLHSDHDFNHPEEKISAIEETTRWFKETL